MADDPSIQAGVLEALEEARNYNAWVTSLVQPHLGADSIELGSGLGYQAELLLGAGTPRLTVTELEADAVALLRGRFADDPRVTVRQVDFSAAPRGEHTAAFAVNVLEHVEDDIGALRSAAGLVRPDGRVVVFVPAFELAMSRFDREIGHYRRYTVAGLRDRLVAAGLEPVSVRYVNAPGLIAWLIWMRLLRKRPTAGLGLRVWDGYVIPATRRLEARVRVPFGQSVLGVARVSDG
jgi:SAM-dependent methyltransferase